MKQIINVKRKDDVYFATYLEGKKNKQQIARITQATYNLFKESLKRQKQLCQLN